MEPKNEPKSKTYWGQVRATEATIADEWPLIVSIDHFQSQTLAGTVTEVSRHAAAKHIVEQTARLASPEEAAAYRADQAKRKAEAEKAADIREAVEKIFPERRRVASEPVPAADAKGKKN